MIVAPSADSLVDSLLPAEEPTVSAPVKPDVERVESPAVGTARFFPLKDRSVYLFNHLPPPVRLLDCAARRDV